MIRFEDVTFRYDPQSRPVLEHVDLVVPEGELCLVVGRTGSGKSTLLRLVNGLVPHFTGGVLSGRVVVDGRDTRLHPPRELADVVGIVAQDPRSAFVADTVEDELAYAMESLALPPDVMRRRVEETLDLLGLAELRQRPLSTLSGGQAQRVAIGAALTASPRVLVLDEPTSALDPGAAEEVLAALQRLVHDLGMTVLLAEHRLERVVQYADSVVLVPGNGRAVVVGHPATVLATSPVAPPVVELGRLAGWEPLPLTVRDARRAAASLRELLAPLAPPPHRPERRPPADSRVVARLERVGVRRGQTAALREVSLDLHAGEVLAVMGRNGAGKSTLFGTLVGLYPRSHGTVSLLAPGSTDGAGRETVIDPGTSKATQVMSRAGLVPQDPGDLLYADSVEEECREADADAAAPAGTARRLLEQLAPGVDPRTHPRDLSEGQRLALALAVVLAAAPPLLLLDEPTRGLDYAAKARLVAMLSQLAAEGHAVVLSTHDVELVAELADRVVVLADGEVVADGPTADVVVSSPAFAPQVSKILAPQPWLTVREVARALGRPLPEPAGAA